ncbi:MAG: hypothetical protein ABSD72_01250 [Terracidiphilus sp.]|jgi:hypothetical protein
MINIQSLRDVFYLIVLSLSFAVIPSWILLAVSRVIGWSLKTSPQEEAADVRLGFWKNVFLGALGGFVGEVMAVAMLYPAESSWCRDMYAQGSYCDGQGPLVLILTVPLCAIIGSCTAIIWTWYSLGIRANNPWASVFSYRGRNRALNVGLVIAVQAVYWVIFAWAIYLFTRSLL